MHAAAKPGAKKVAVKKEGGEKKEKKAPAERKRKARSESAEPSQRSKRSKGEGGGSSGKVRLAGVGMPGWGMLLRPSWIVLAGPS